MTPKKSTKLETVDELKKELLELTPKPKQELTLRDTVFCLQEELSRALKLGYSYEDLVKLLKNKGVEISTETLKNYLGEAKRKTRSTPKKKMIPKETSVDTTEVKAKKPVTKETKNKSKQEKSPAGFVEMPDKL